MGSATLGAEYSKTVSFPFYNGFECIDSLALQKTISNALVRLHKIPVLTILVQKGNSAKVYWLLGYLTLSEDPGQRPQPDYACASHSLSSDDDQIQARGDENSLSRRGQGSIRILV